MADEAKIDAVVVELAEPSGKEEGSGNSGEPDSKKTSLQKALQSKLDEVRYHSTEAFISSLPASVKRRVKALKKLQSEYFTVESKFFNELHLLECKYELLYGPIQNKRSDIVNAKLEPTDSECDWPSDEEEEGEKKGKSDKTGSTAADKLATLTVTDEAKTAAPDAKVTEPASSDAVTAPVEDPKGIPEFWLQIFKHADMLAELLEEHDKPVLKHLIDVRLVVQPDDPALFKLEFVFEPNEFFTNSILTKEYYLTYEMDKKEPLTYDGPQIDKCKGCKIDWKEGKNVTEKTVTKTQRHKTKGTTKTVSKVVAADSFFNFFSPPEVLDHVEPDDETEEILSNDYEVGHFLRDQVIPRAVLFYTGEALVDDDDDNEDSDEDEDEATSSASDSGKDSDS